MLYSKSLLNKFIANLDQPQQLWDVLTLKVCEVEEIHQRQIPDDLVIWLVTETRDHPDADKLTVCQVDCWSKWIFQICCWASNVRTWLYVVVALPWCHLPAIDLTIEPRELRGEASNGMICSKQELWIEEDQEHKWIWSLQLSDKASTQAKWEVENAWDFDDLTKSDLWVWLSKKYPRLDSWTMDVENKTITHRPDMFGHYWLAVELQTIYENVSQTEFFASSYNKGKDAYLMEEDYIQHKIDVVIESSKVYSYSTILLKNIVWKKSDIENRLLMSDLWLQSKSNWIDFSNTFMYLSWQPIHFFDADKIKWWLIVRQAKDWETFIDLFDKEYKLTSNDIVIADQAGICALAWIIWSNSSWIDENTKNILVEIANFDPIQVRKTWTRLWLRTDAELRFEKSINPMWSSKCLDSFLSYIEQSDLEYEYAWKQIWTYEGMQTELSSMNISRDTISSIIWLDAKQMWLWSLQKLWFDIDWDNVKIPAWRSLEDITTEACIIEEILRIYWFDTITSTSYLDESKFLSFNHEIEHVRKLESLMIERMWFDQIETYPWIPKKMIDLFNFSTSELLEMENSLNPEWVYLRPTLMLSLLDTLQKNNAFFDSIDVFDIWNIRWTDDNHSESKALAFCVSWPSSDNLDSIYLKAKGIIDTILETIWSKWKLQYIQSENEMFHPKQQAWITLNWKSVGKLNTLHPYVSEQFKIDSTRSIVLAELDLTVLFDIALSQQKKTKWMSSYNTLQDQILTRDLNFIVDESKGFWEILSAVHKVKEVSSIDIFDVYAWEHLPEGKKSIALRMQIIGTQDLKTDQINDIMNKAIENVKSVWGILR